MVSEWNDWKSHGGYIYCLWHGRNTNIYYHLLQSILVTHYQPTGGGNILPLSFSLFHLEFRCSLTWVLGIKNSELLLQILVSFFVQSRKEMCKEYLLSPFPALTFLRQFCHLWLLRVSFVVFDLVISGIWAAHLPQVRPSKHSSDNPKASFWGSIKCKKNGSYW